MLPRVTLYTRTGCHLCDTAKEQLRLARQSTQFDFEEVDIDSDPELRALYSEEVPVISINGRKAFKFFVNEQEFVKRLKDRS